MDFTVGSKKISIVLSENDNGKFNLSEVREYGENALTDEQVLEIANLIRTSGTNVNVRVSHKTIAIDYSDIERETAGDIICGDFLAFSTVGQMKLIDLITATATEMYAIGKGDRI